MRALIAILVALALFGCLGPGLTPIEEIRTDPDTYLGEQVAVKGTVSDSFKLGKLSGFKLTDEEGSSIMVSSDSLPSDGKEVIVEGTVMREAIVGTYILAKEISD